MPSVSLRRVVVVIVGFVCSGVLLGFLFYRFPLDATYIDTLRQVRWAGLLALLLTTTLHCVITAWKWQIVTRMGNPDVVFSTRLFTMYSALIALLGQVMPLQVAVLAGRSIALRVHAAEPMRRSAGGAIYDQGFDLLVPALVMIPGIVYLCGWASAALALWGVVLALAVGGLLLGVWGEGLIGALLRCITAVAPQRVAVRIAAIPTVYGSNRSLLRLYLWSVIRCANLVVRAWLVAWTLQLHIDPIAILFGHCAVTFSVVVNFVPGALGVAEWGWLGILNLAGVSSTDALHYSLSSRLLIVLSLIALNGLLALGELVRRRIRS